MTRCAAALEAVDRFAVPVFPCSIDNTPLFPSAHPIGDPLRGKCKGECGRVGHGFHDATTEHDTITAWWTASPRANIGARTGVAFDVLDIDHTDFVTGVADLPDGETDGGPVARSGGGGWHLYFKPTGLGRVIRFSKHCDWLGTDGYVIVPPSGHRSGGTYSWFASAEVALTEAPSTLIDAVRSARQPPPRAEGLGTAVPTTVRRSATPGAWNPAGIIGRLATAPEGERNDTLVWAAWRVGYDVHDRKATRPEADNACDQLHSVARMIGLDELEIIATIKSGYGAGLSGKTRRSVA